MNKTRDSMKIIKYFVFMFLLSFTVFAKDYALKDNDEIEVIISKNNINRLKVFNDRIKDIRSNSNELIIETDKTSGEIYLKPTYGKDKIDVFLKTENGFTYKLILKVKDISSQQIFINRNDFTLQNYANADVLRREKLNLINENLYFNFEDEYKLSSINLIRAMSSNAILKEFRIIDRKHQNLLNYKNFKIDWLYSYIKNDRSGISGEITKITNISHRNIFLKEEMFFRKGIRAVRLEKLELRPKESCYLYFIGGNK